MRGNETIYDDTKCTFRIDFEPLLIPLKTVLDMKLPSQTIMKNITKESDSYLYWKKITGENINSIFNSYSSSKISSLAYPKDFKIVRITKKNSDHHLQLDVICKAGNLERCLTKFLSMDRFTISNDRTKYTLFARILDKNIVVRDDDDDDDDDDDSDGEAEEVVKLRRRLQKQRHQERSGLSQLNKLSPKNIQFVDKLLTMVQSGDIYIKESEGDVLISQVASELILDENNKLTFLIK